MGPRVTGMPEKHGFGRNPFDEGRYDHEMIGRKAETQRIFRLVDEAARQQHSSIVPVVAPFGMGKTFTFLQLREKFRLREAPFRDSKILGVYLTATKERFPSKYSFYIFNRTMEDLGEDGLVSLSNEIPKTAPERVLQGLSEPNFSAALRNMSNEQNRHMIWNWLRGGSIPSKKAADLGIYGRIRDEEARRLLLDLCRFLAKIGYDCFVLLIDELEQAYAQSNSHEKVIVWVREWYDEVNRIVSQSSEAIVPTVTFMGCAPDTWSAIAASVQRGKSKGAYGQVAAFFDRIPPENHVELGPLDVGEVEQLLESLLASEAKRKQNNPLYPFDRESAKLIYDTSQGVPRMAIRLARILLREADKANEPITLDNADRWLRSAKVTVG
jgi:hypothetical protein